jgi:Glyoxalase superfamily protein
MKSVIPILRIFVERKAKEFYLYYSGFRLDWSIGLSRNIHCIFKFQTKPFRFIYPSITEIARRGQPSEFSAKIFKIIIVYSNLKNILTQIQELKRLHGTHMN